ncbi:MAG: hypothetical protein HN348_26125, partial [Proteobacteria bacterium]|nr:hypothetical protein [Pseudomonadota bacterium]
MPHLAILWHLHQPDYRHPETGRPVMPWVRMHAIRGYRDMAVETVEYGIPWTLNLVPSLLDQLAYYAEGGDDRHLELTRRRASELTYQEVDEVCRTFATGHPMISDAHRTYAQLRTRVDSGERLAGSDLLDLQVWSTLSWFGATALRDYPELDELCQKGSGFNENDKAVVVEVQTAILEEIIGLYAKVAQTDSVALSTSPYYHPILPLLVNTAHAKRCLPGFEGGVGFSFPEDALEQLVRARQRMEAEFGVAPTGVWPSEGSVSPEAVELIRQAGFSWLATDEGILHRSESVGHGRGPWRVAEGLVGFFRDHDLSDRIGFHYATRGADWAAQDLIAEATKRVGQEGTLTIALDGENPWESYKNAGAPFRLALLRAAEKGSLRLISLDDAAELEPVGSVTHIHTGSWIGANLAIWIGDPVDRQAWRLLAQTREAAEQAAPDQKKAALEHIYKAEGSDWTWWYGEEFTTPFAMLFDALFRLHLKAAWAAIGRQPPKALELPLAKKVAGYAIAPPKCAIEPPLDGDAAWIHWAGAGQARWPMGSSMARGAVHTTGFRFGWSVSGDLWVRVMLADPLPEGDAKAKWELTIGDARAELPYGVVGAQLDSGDLKVVAGKSSLVLCHSGQPADIPLWVGVTDNRGVQAQYPEFGQVVLPHGGLPP